MERHNKSAYYFLSLLKEIVEEKGNTFEYIKKDKLQKTKISNEIYNNLLDAPLISYEQSILYTQKQRSEAHV